MKYFLAGARGMLASDLLPLLESRGDVCRGVRPAFDITDFDSVSRQIKSFNPHVVINCAAYTAVDKAEEEKELAYKVNGEGAGNLAHVCKELGCRLVHISTDFVFDGEDNRPYLEDDATNPLSVYGFSKLKGEKLIAETTDDYIIVRTSWLYGHHGNNFVKTIKRLAQERESLGIVFDQVGTPTYTKDLAEGIVNLIASEAKGIYHFSNEGVCSWYDFAYEIIGLLREDNVSLALRNLRPILTEDYPTPAVRPSYSVLNKLKYKEKTSKEVPYWKDALARYFRES